LSAQFEHTVLVTESGVEVLTLGAGEIPLLTPREAAAPAPCGETLSPAQSPL